VPVRGTALELEGVTGLVVKVQTASAAGTFREAEAETGMPSAEAQEALRGITDRVRGRVATGAQAVWGREAAVVPGVGVVAAAGDRP